MMRDNRSASGPRIVVVVELIAGRLVARVAPASTRPPRLARIGTSSPCPPSPTDRPFPRRVRRLRKRLGNITAGELAERLGVGPETVKNWELGLHRPQPSNHRAVLRLERQWRVAFNDFCRREEPQE